MDSFKMILLLIMVLILIIPLFCMRKNKNENEKLKKIVYESNKQYRDVVELNRNLKNIRHDINKQKAIMKDIDNNDDIKKYTGVDVIDKIIHVKSKEMYSKNIEFKIDATGLADVNIGEGALISILSNIFDNAIEACDNLEKPWIRCDILINIDGMLCMTVDNSKSKDIKIDEGNVVTTKTDTTVHGYGLGIIKELTCKNGGNISIEDRGNVFSLSIRI